RAGTSVRSPSAGSAGNRGYGVGRAIFLDQAKEGGETAGGPREGTLPSGQVSGGSCQLPPEALVSLTGRGRRGSARQFSSLPGSTPTCTGPRPGASLRSAQRRLAPVALRKWLTVWLPLTG